MTRRLDPEDRVKELSGASVPFPFDIHAMIYSEDAPTLETKLHRAFNDKRVNLINQKREFFNVSLDEIKSFIEENHGEFKLTKVAEASQFRETMAMRKEHVTPEFDPNEELLGEIQEDFNEFNDVA
ncbi:MAG: GIY-YIG nuclease family protein [Cetobacterium sp.]